MGNNTIIFNRIVIEIKMVTPEYAKNILDNHNNANRHINKAHVKALLNNMVQGTWRFNGDSIRFDNEGMLIDGQHRLSALVEYGKPLPMIVISGFDKETMKTIDQEIKPRNLADLFRIDGVKEANNVAGIITRYFAIKLSNAFISSCRYEQRNPSASSYATRTITVDDKYNEYMSHSIFFDDLVIYARRCYSNTRLLKISEIGGVYAYLYFQKHHSDDEIQGFFNRLCFTETDINVINLLRDIYIRDPRTKNPMTSFVKSQYLTKAWNYYIKGKDVKVLSYNKSTEGTIEFI